MQTVAQAWLVYRITGSSLLLGVVGFAGQIPIFLFAPVGGLAADRLNRHRVVIGHASRFDDSGVYPRGADAAARNKIWEIVVLAALLGVVNAFDVPARQSFLIEMVVREDLMNAIALNSSMFNGARIIGPAIAGILVARIGEGWCFFANAVSYIAVIIGLLLMKLGPLRTAPKGSSPFEHIVEGFRYVRDTAPMRALILLIGLVSLVAVPYSVLMPIFADRVLHRGAHGLGILMGAAGVGALFGALTWPCGRACGAWTRRGSLGRRLRRFVDPFLFLEIILAVGGIADSSWLRRHAGNVRLEHADSSDGARRIRGRAMAMYTMMFMGMAPIRRSLLAGALADGIGAPFTVALGGVGAIAGGIAFVRHWPTLRLQARELLIAQGVPVSEIVQK